MKCILLLIANVSTPTYLHSGPRINFIPKSGDYISQIKTWGDFNKKKFQKFLFSTNFHNQSKVVPTVRC